jgi:hypothetical protein
VRQSRQTQETAIFRALQKQLDGWRAGIVDMPGGTREQLAKADRQWELVLALIWCAERAATSVDATGDLLDEALQIPGDVPSEIKRQNPEWLRCHIALFADLPRNVLEIPVALCQPGAQIGELATLILEVIPSENGQPLQHAANLFAGSGYPQFRKSIEEGWHWAAESFRASLKPDQDKPLPSILWRLVEDYYPAGYTELSPKARTSPEATKVQLPDGISAGMGAAVGAWHAMNGTQPDDHVFLLGAIEGDSDGSLRSEGLDRNVITAKVRAILAGCPNATVVVFDDAGYVAASKQLEGQSGVVVRKPEGDSLSAALRVRSRQVEYLRLYLDKLQHRQTLLQWLSVTERQRLARVLAPFGVGKFVEARKSTPQQTGGLADGVFKFFGGNRQIAGQGPRWQTQAIDWKTECRQVRRAAVVGLPGIGKSTLLSETASGFAQEWVTSMEDWTHCEAPFPILLRCATLGANLKSAGGAVGAICDSISAAAFDMVGAADQLGGVDGLLWRGCFSGWLRERAQTSRCILLLDGFDECSDEEKVQIETFLWVISKLGWNVRILVASRYDVLNWEKFGLEGYEMWYLGPKTVADLVRRAHEALGQPEAAQHLLEVYERNEELRVACEIPLVALLACVINCVERLPLDTRSIDLWDKFLRHILSRSAKPQPVAPNSDEVNRLLGLLDSAGVSLAGREPNRSVSKAVFEACVSSREDRQKLLDSGLLFQYGSEGDYLFLHAYFQGYIAARTLAHSVDGEKSEKAWADIRDIAHRSAWTGVIRFLAAILGARDAQAPDPNPARKQIVRLISILTDPKLDDIFGHGVVLAVQCLAELPEETREDLRPKCRRVAQRALDFWWLTSDYTYYEWKRYVPEWPHLESALPLLPKIDPDLPLKLARGLRPSVIRHLANRAVRVLRQGLKPLEDRMDNVTAKWLFVFGVLFGIVVAYCAFRLMGFIITIVIAFLVWNKCRKLGFELRRSGNVPILPRSALNSGPVEKGLVCLSAMGRSASGALPLLPSDPESMDSWYPHNREAVQDLQALWTNKPAPSETDSNEREPDSLKGIHYEISAVCNVLGVPGPTEMSAEALWEALTTLLKFHRFHLYQFKRLVSSFRELLSAAPEVAHRDSDLERLLTNTIVASPVEFAIGSIWVLDAMGPTVDAALFDSALLQAMQRSFFREHFKLDELRAGMFVSVKSTFQSVGLFVLRLVTCPMMGIDENKRWHTDMGARAQPAYADLRAIALFVLCRRHPVAEVADGRRSALQIRGRLEAQLQDFEYIRQWSYGWPTASTRLIDCLTRQGFRFHTKGKGIRYFLLQALAWPFASGMRAFFGLLALALVVEIAVLFPASKTTLSHSVSLFFFHPFKFFSMEMPRPSLPLPWYRIAFARGMFLFFLLFVSGMWTRIGRFFFRRLSYIRLLLPGRE